jgi:tetratricopeptide (TPR) repeat protein
MNLAPAVATVTLMIAAPATGAPATVALVSAPAVAAAAPESLLARADRLLERHQPEMALQLFQQIPAEGPAGLRAQLGLGACLFYLEKLEAAARTLRRLRERCGTDPAGEEVMPACLELLGQVYVHQGRLGWARQVFEDLVEVAPDRGPHAAVMIARTYVREGSWRKALQRLTPVLRQGRHQPAYDLALELYWQLKGADRRKLDRLLAGYLDRSR